MDNAQERAALIHWLEKDVGMAIMRMRLMGGIPGGKAHVRAEQKQWLSGIEHAHKMILEGVKRGDHLTPPTRQGEER